jgi:hypothetical protein
MVNIYLNKKKVQTKDTKSSTMFSPIPSNVRADSNAPTCMCVYVCVFVRVCVCV